MLSRRARATLWLMVLPLYERDRALQILPHINCVGGTAHQFKLLSLPFKDEVDQTMACVHSQTPWPMLSCVNDVYWHGFRTLISGRSGVDSPQKSLILVISLCCRLMSVISLGGPGIDIL